MNWQAVLLYLLAIGSSGASMGAMLQFAIGGFGVISATAATAFAGFIAASLVEGGPR